MGPRVVCTPRTRVGLLDTTADGETGRGQEDAVTTGPCPGASAYSPRPPSTPFRGRQTSPVTRDREAIVDGFGARLGVHGLLRHHASS